MKHKNLELKNNFQLKIPEGKILKGFSKEYSNLGNVIQIAKEYVNFENNKRDLDEYLP